MASLWNKELREEAWFCGAQQDKESFDTWARANSDRLGAC